MPRPPRHELEGSDDEADEPIDEGPDARDLDPEESEDDAPIEECPACRREIHADTEWCPYCGEPVRRETRPLPTWAWIAAVLAVLSAVLWLVR